MRIVCASGKGGTGKTTIATNLALSIADRGPYPVFYCDCDVEEPNGHIFLKPEISSRENIGAPEPLVDLDKCTGCGECSRICQYKAIMATKKTVLVFPELCHGCAGCWLVCPEGAIRESSRHIGIIEAGESYGNLNFVQGKLRIGEAQAVPLIRELKRRIPPEGVVIIDAPPGTSCPVIESVKGADLVLLVTEPTPFGLHDLRLAVEMVRELKIPFCVVINRAGMGGDDEMDRYLNGEGIETYLRIPHDRKIAEVYSNGEMMINALPEYKSDFTGLWKRIREGDGR